MKTITRIEAIAPKPMPKRKRVAAYARISMSTEQMLHSFSAQVSYYNNLIQSNPQWEYAGVYADNGISGTSIKDRKDFQRMIADCDAGKIDIILVKSISRFARNTVDLLNTVRHLKDIGVEVRFEREKINTLTMDGEFMLGLLATFAQEESRSTSENIKWKIRKSYSEGRLITSQHRLLGYKWDGQNYAIVPQEAEWVRRIFEIYLTGLSLKKMAEQVEKEGIRSCKGNVIDWTNVYDIVQNEIYAGDRLLQKWYVEDSLTHHKVRNRGQLPKFYHKDVHPAIIDRATWEAAKAETQRRQYEFARLRHPFSKMIKCGICGKTYCHKINCTSGQEKWGCLSKEKGKGGCKNVNLMQRELDNATCKVLGVDKYDEELLRAKVKEIIVQPESILEFHFYDGRVKKEAFVSDRIELYQQLRGTALYQGIYITCGIHGHKLWHSLINGNHYWKCGLMVQHKVECKCWHHIAAKELLKKIEDITGRENLVLEDIAGIIREIKMLPDNVIEFHFEDGRIEKCQRT